MDLNTSITEFIGGLLLLLGVTCVVIGTVDAIELKSRRKKLSHPDEVKFSAMRSRYTVRKTVALPAFAALLAGFLVSVSSTSIYDGVDSANSFKFLIGMILFVSSFIALILMLNSVIYGVDDAIELTRDPYGIAAAAKEYRLDPQNASLNPDQLDAQLEIWGKYLPARAVGSSSNSEKAKNTAELRDALTDAAGVKRIEVRQWVRVYWLSLQRFFFLYWIPVAATLIIPGSTLFFSESWILALILSVLATFIFVAFYCYQSAAHSVRYFAILKSATSKASEQTKLAKERSNKLVEEELNRTRFEKEMMTFVNAYNNTPPKANRCACPICKWLRT